jgi:hypothetical protein
MDVKKSYREVEDKARELGREVDGHDVGDDIGNAGDEIRKDLGNTGDDLRRSADEARREAEVQRKLPDDEPFKDEPFKDEPR